MKKVVLIYFTLLLILSAIFSMPFSVLANDSTDDGSDSSDLNVTEETLLDAESVEQQEESAANDDSELIEELDEAVTIENQAAEFAASDLETINIPIEIIWDHGFNDGPLPVSVDLYLYDENGVEVAMVTVEESDFWLHTFTNLEPGDYTVRQGAIEDYDIVYVREDAGNFRINNMYYPAEVPIEPETINVPVQIVWVHGDNTEPFPTSVDIYLYDENGVEVNVVTVDASDGWQHTFTDMSIQDYTVREAAIENYDIAYARDEAGNFTVTNTYYPPAEPVEPETMDVPVQVVWIHGENAGPLPTSVDLYLYSEAGVLIDTVTVTASDEWYYMFTDLVPDDYTVRQGAIDNYGIDYSREQTGEYIVRNTFIPPAPETIDIPVEIVWVHADNTGPFPISVDIYLYNEAGVEVAVVTVDESDGWQHTFTDLEPGDYTVWEAAVENYVISYARDESGQITITNTYHTAAPETINIPVEVVWVHGDNKGPFPMSVDIYLFDEDGVEIERITIDEAEGWKVTFIDLEPGEYTVREAAIENYDINYSRDESGKITITNTYLPPAPETMDIPVEIVWVHGDNKGPFPTSVDLYLYNGAGVLVDKVTVDASDGWKHTFNDLEPGEYTVREAAIDYYAINYSRDDTGKITITNTYIPVKNPEVPNTPETPTAPSEPDPETPAEEVKELPATGTAQNNTITIIAGILLAIGAGLLFFIRRNTV